MTTDTDPVSHWRTSLQQWGIPAHILDQAPQSPWIHPVESFRPVGDLHVDTPSRQRALEALMRATTTGQRSVSVLDVGCGGGRAALGLVPPAERLVGVDHQQAMLDVFVDEASARGALVETRCGNWPDVADVTPSCDVVVCHHVVYNVQDLVPFVEQLTRHAAQRVVLELPLRHPLSKLSGAWQHFWGLTRPDSPTSLDALAVVRSTGVDAHHEEFTTDDDASSAADVTDLEVEHTRIRLCLAADRDTEIRSFLRDHPAGPRRLATIWWDA